MEWRYGNALIWGSVDTIGGSDSGRPRNVRPGKVFSAVRWTCMSRTRPTGFASNGHHPWPSKLLARGTLGSKVKAKPEMTLSALVRQQDPDLFQYSCF